MKTGLRKHVVAPWLASLLVALACLMAMPASTYAQPSAAGERCFNETGYCIAGRIREYWEQNGGLPVFGFPIRPQQEELVEGQPLQVQWFERHRLELHPENQRPYDVLLGRLGAQRFAQSGVPSEPESANPNCQFFAQTGFNVCGRFLQAWRSDGLEFDGRAGKSYAESLALFGLPLSNEQSYNSPDGGTFTVQWFERARFEHHPENGPPYDVLFGLLGNESSAGLAPVTKGQIVFTSDRDGNNEIYLMNSDGSDQRRLTNDPRDDASPVWSPDGSTIAFLRTTSEPNADPRTALWVMNADGSNPLDIGVQIVQPFLSVRSFGWSPDSKQLVLSFERSPEAIDLAVVAVDGSYATDIAYNGVGNFDRNTNPAWSPDGSTIAFLSNRDGADRLYRVNADGSNLVKLADAAALEQPVWTADGNDVLFVVNGQQVGSIVRARSDGSGIATLLTAKDQVSGLALSPDGSRIAYQVTNRNSQNVPVGTALWLARSNGSEAIERGFLGSTTSAIAWAANNRTLAFTNSCTRSAPTTNCSSDVDIVVMDANGANRLQLTQNSGRNFQPNWRQR